MFLWAWKWCSKPLTMLVFRILAQVVYVAYKNVANPPIYSSETRPFDHWHQTRVSSWSWAPTIPWNQPTKWMVALPLSDFWHEIKSHQWYTVIDLLEASWYICWPLQERTTRRLQTDSPVFHFCLCGKNWLPSQHITDRDIRTWPAFV